MSERGNWKKGPIIGENSKCSCIEAILISVASYKRMCFTITLFASFFIFENLIIIAHPNVVKVGVLSDFAAFLKKINLKIPNFFQYCQSTT